MMVHFALKVYQSSHAWSLNTSIKFKSVDDFTDGQNAVL